MEDKNTNFYEQMPVLPLRGLTLFPGMTIHFDVGRERSSNALKAAMLRDQMRELKGHLDELKK